LLAGTAISLLCEISNHARLSRNGVSAGGHLISSLGLYIIITQLIVMKWGSDAQTLRHGVSRVINISGILLTSPQIVVASVSALVIALFFLWLRFSRKGLQFRALSDNANEVALRGYNIKRLRLLAFGMSGLLCSAGAIVLSYDRGFSPYGGMTAILLAVVAMIVGGRQTFVGPVIGGLVLGVLREETAYLFAARWQELFTFLLLALFILVKPSGLIGNKGRLEAES
jgi:branched-chain amino acid transport system permease protein